MTLLDIITFVCNEMGLYDDVSLDLARKFADFEYKMLWDRYPWNDTQALARIPVFGGLDSFVLPEQLQRIISIESTTVDVISGYKSDAHMLEPVTTTFMIESDPTVFLRGGYPQYYEESVDPATGITNVRIYPTPILTQSYFIAGKGVCAGLLQDTDSPRIRNIDNVIIAYVLSDMLKRQRQYGKAEQQRQVAKDLEQAAWSVEQDQANKPRKNKAITAAGNSLIEMVDAVCAICGTWTPEVRLIIREFVRRNYQALYDIFLWPESVIMVTMKTLGQQVILPHYVDKVLGIRSNENFRMSPADQTLILDITPTMFEEFGSAISYNFLTPVGVAVLPLVQSRLRLTSTSGVDIGKVFIRGEVIQGGIEQSEEVMLQGTTPVDTALSYDIPLTVAKDVTFGDLIVNASDVTFTPQLAFIPANERERKQQRLMLVPIPPDGGNILILGKRKILPLQGDQDTPIITGIQQVLIAGAAADTLASLGKADMVADQRKKADVGAAVLMKKNEDQQAHEPRFVPQIEPHAYTRGGIAVWSK